ncbi:potassium-transporting ATPase subunit KdpA, partial [Escherichia coli]|uniref:potassium-transporting ATPase subunit KdpA n=1 Tax=Escherichia coli TaxID=562 RepID=UPI00135260B5
IVCTGIGGLVRVCVMGSVDWVLRRGGSGLYGMMLYVLVAVFIAGMMNVRRPEYLGKRIDGRARILTALASLVTPTMVLMGAALA